MTLTKHHRADAARAMAEQYGVSLRTAQRHLLRGTTPRADRVTGADGKSYPKPAPKPPPLPRHTALLSETRTLLRLFRLRPHLLTEGDRALVEDVAEAAAGVLRTTTT